MNKIQVKAFFVRLQLSESDCGCCTTLGQNFSLEANYKAILKINI